LISYSEVRPWTKFELGPFWIQSWDVLEIRLVEVATKLHLLAEGDNIRWSIQIEVLMTPHFASRPATSLNFIYQQCSSIL
jgi:hypothetical protein